MDVVGPAVDAAGTRVLRVADDAELGRQHDLVAARADRLADQPLVGVRPVDVGGVQQRHAQVQGAVDGGDRLLFVGDAVELRHAHAAEALGRDGQSLASKLALIHTGEVSGALAPPWPSPSDPLARPSTSNLTHTAIPA